MRGYGRDKNKKGKFYLNFLNKKDQSEKIYWIIFVLSLTILLFDFFYIRAKKTQSTFDAVSQILLYVGFLLLIYSVVQISSEKKTEQKKVTYDKNIKIPDFFLKLLQDDIDKDQKNYNEDDYNIHIFGSYKFPPIIKKERELKPESILDIDKEENGFIF
jgi:hypothetical protein